MSVHEFAVVRPGLGKIFRRSVFLVAVLLVSAQILSSRLSDLDLADLGSAIASITTGAWIMAIVASAVSFAAIGQYDALFHGWLRTRIPPARAAVSGAASIALAQTLGFGLATGTLARWRALPDLSFQDAWRLSSYVSFSFMAALGVLIALAGALSPIEQPGLRVFAALAIAAAILAFVLSIFAPSCFLFRLPPVRLMMRLLGLAAIDTAFAGIALWLLLPADLQPDPAIFIAAFLLALGAGLLSGTPGGVGTFEVCIFALLPGVPSPEMIAAILGFRLIYHGLPACLALLVLARPQYPRSVIDQIRSPSPPHARAEAGLAHLPTHELTRIGAQMVLTARASQTLVVIGDPVCGAPLTRPGLDTLSKVADAESLWPVLYKISARSAVMARRSGWQTLAVSEEAWIDPRTFSIDGPQLRQLRRKLRQAVTAGVVSEFAVNLPLNEMTEVAEEWAFRSGGERGFSMGRFDPDYLARQRVYLAWRDDRLLAFVSFHTCEDEWTLDLVRGRDGLPHGTIHALVVRAIEDATIMGIPRVSLAATPLANPPGLLKRIARSREGMGLRQFKLSFAPRTERLYLAAPSRRLLLLAGMDILLRIKFPDARTFHKSVGLQAFVAQASIDLFSSIKQCVGHYIGSLSSHAGKSLPQCSISGCPALTSSPSSTGRTMGPSKIIGVVDMNFMAELEKRRAYNRTVRELSRLPLDVALDLDIYPGDAEKIAKRAVYGK